MIAAAPASSRSGLGRGASRGPAYGSAQDAALTPRQAEYRIFARVTHALSEAGSAVSSGEPGGTARLAAAAYDNLRMWYALAEDLAGDANGLPDELRAGLISLAAFVERETPKVISRNVPVSSLVDVNTAVMKGLRGHREPA